MALPRQPAGPPRESSLTRTQCRPPAGTGDHRNPYPPRDVTTDPTGRALPVIAVPSLLPAVPGPGAGPTVHPTAGAACRRVRPDM